MSGRSKGRVGYFQAADVAPKKNMTDSIQFVAFVKPQPQGSMKGFIPKGWKRPVLTSDNKQLKSFRQEVACAALKAAGRNGLDAAVFEKHVPVIMCVKFYFAKPDSCPKKRALPVTRPDVDKLVRSTFDSLKGIIFYDDSQVVQVQAYKFYGTPERVEIEVGKPEFP